MIAELLVGDERLLAERRMPQLAVMAEVGDVAEQRDISIGETADDSHVMLLGALADLGEHVVVEPGAVEPVVFAQRGEDREEQDRRAAQAARCRYRGPGCDLRPRGRQLGS